MWKGVAVVGIIYKMASCSVIWQCTLPLKMFCVKSGLYPFLLQGAGFDEEYDDDEDQNLM